MLGTPQTNYGVNEKGWICVRVIRDSQFKKGHQNYVDGKYSYHKMMSGSTSNYRAVKNTWIQLRSNINGFFVRQDAKINEDSK